MFSARRGFVIPGRKVTLALLALPTLTNCAPSGRRGAVLFCPVPQAPLALLASHGVTEARLLSEPDKA